jgi:predicted AlkP superfamily pyrophosphatase or phosphodiesterase
MHLSAIWVFFQFSLWENSNAARQTAGIPRLLIISLDGEIFSLIVRENDLFYKGFRHDYLNEHQLPTINRFRNEGVQATRGMRPTFTTMTYPNHISIATGGEISFYQSSELVFFRIKFRNVSRRSWNHP